MPTMNNKRTSNGPIRPKKTYMNRTTTYESLGDSLVDNTNRKKTIKVSKETPNRKNELGVKNKTIESSNSSDKSTYSKKKQLPVFYPNERGVLKPNILTKEKTATSNKNNRLEKSFTKSKSNIIDVNRNKSKKIEITDTGYKKLKTGGKLQKESNTKVLKATITKTKNSPKNILRDETKTKTKTKIINPKRAERIIERKKDKLMKKSYKENEKYNKL